MSHARHTSLVEQGVTSTAMMLLEMSFPVLSSDTAPQFCNVEATYDAISDATKTTNFLSNWQC